MNKSEKEKWMRCRQKQKNEKNGDKKMFTTQ